MAKTPVESALAWRGLIRRIRHDQGLSELNYPDWLVLAFINYESDGDPAAVNGSHVGLLQVKQSNAEETGRSADLLDGRKRDPDLAARESIAHFFQFMEKYDNWKPQGFSREVGHRFEPELMAILWKGGAGTLRDYVIALEDRGKEAAEKFLAGVSESHVQYRDDIIDLMSQLASRPVPSADGRRMPSGKVAPFSSGVVRPKCASRTAAREEGPPEGVSELIEGLRGVGQALGVSTFVDPVADHLENLAMHPGTGNPTLAPSTSGAAREHRADGYLGGSRDFKARSVSILLPDFTTFFCKPLDTFEFRDPFAHPRGPGRIHLGIDFETRTKAQILANARTDLARGVTGRRPCHVVADGEVIFTGILGFYGRVIYVHHGGGVTTRYAHLHEIQVSTGERVTRSQVIGVTGTSEKADGKFREDGVTIPHLHFELRINAQAAAGGRPDKRLTHNDHNVAIDPIPILRSAPFPNEALEKRSSQRKLLARGRAALGSLLATAATDFATLEGTRGYDQVSAQERALMVAEMDRREHWDEQARNVAVQQTTLDREIDLPFFAFARYEPLPGDD